MSLSSEEHEMMVAAGTTLVTVLDPVDHDREDAIYPVGAEIDERRLTVTLPDGQEIQTQPLEAGLGRYVMFGACGNLTNVLGVEQCSIYDKRPQVCREFKVGKTGCAILRRQAGLETPDIDLRDLIS